MYVVKNAPANFKTTLEIGAGLGEHLDYERLSAQQLSNYVAVDIRENMVDVLTRRYPQVVGIVADCQQSLQYEDGHFDRILAIHVLEHLPNLPAAIRELHRVCNKEHGVLSVVIPCEGSLAYGIARRLSAQRIFEKRYKQSYKWFIEREHINLPREIFAELDPYFEQTAATYFPLPIALEVCNLCIGATLRPRITVGHR
jgi:ubiquinone/menaquinone biosynthesis C-methylase UbiE